MNFVKAVIIMIMSILLSEDIAAQNPIQQFWALNQNTYLLDKAAPVGNASFAYSLRKLRRKYTGFSIRVRRGTDNAEADIAFDAQGIISTNSIATVTAAGSSGLAIGTNLSLSTFKGTRQLFVSRWYDQGSNDYHAIQSMSALQPELQMNTAGTGSTKPSLLFNGSNYLELNQPIENIVLNGVNGTFLFALKTTANSSHFAFGYRNPSTDWRWSFHINWGDGYFYFDAAETCCATRRRFLNRDNINVWKQYTAIRGTSYKTVRVSGMATTLDSSSAASAMKTGGQFYIGYAYEKPLHDTSFEGSMSEVIIFPKDFSLAEVRPLESDQVNYWGL